MFKQSFIVRLSKALLLILFLSSACVASLRSALAETRIPLQVEAAAKRPLTIVDSIEMRRLVDLERPEALGVLGPLENFDFSMDGRHFYIVTRKGNVESGLNEYELILYNSDKVLRYVDGDQLGLQSLGRVLARFSTPSEHGLKRQNAIYDVRWQPDNQTILFIGDTGEKPGQVFSVNIFSGELEQLTNHDRAVIAFDIDAQSQSLLYLSTLPNLREDRNSTSIVVGTEWIANITSMDKERTSSSIKYQMYFQPLGQRISARRVGSPYTGGKKYRRDFWLSPDGAKAIVTTPYKDGIPSQVRNYVPIMESESLIEASSSFDENYMISDTRLFRQFQLLDIESGNFEQILDGAPIALGVSHYGAMWLPDSSSVILADTFLPKQKSDAAEWQRRRESPAIVSYDLRTKQIERIIDQTVSIVPGRHIQAATLEFKRLYLGSNGLVTIDFQNNAYTALSISVQDDSVPSKSFLFIEGRWIEVDGKKYGQAEKNETQRLLLSVRQDLHIPPEIVAHDSESGKQRVITDLNPQFKRLTFGKVKKIEWPDAEERIWRGHLIYPPGFDSSKRYPLVIQTRGIREGQFVMDGAKPQGAFSAQALANRDIVVLQMGRLGQTDNLYSHGFALGYPVELTAHRRGTEAAIDMLDNSGLIDRTRVGMVGISRSGYYVDDMMICSDYDLAAAQISDGSSLSFGFLFQLYGLAAPSMRRTEKILGDYLPWGQGLRQLASRTTTFNLDRVMTPVRMVQYLNNRNYSGHWWDQYSLLRRMRKPAELVLFPRAYHAPISPNVRFDAMTGTVDWFAFWLKDEEDPDPAKTEQYKRWREMRKQQEISVRTATDARESARKRNPEQECHFGW